MDLKLADKEHLVDNVWAFRFQPNKPLPYIAGQYIRVDLPHDDPDDEGTSRWFTNSAAPFEGIVQITTRITQSSFKRALSNLELGDTLKLIEKPDGDFIWQEQANPLVFIAGGIGITPFRSILKQRIHENQPVDVTLLYGGRTDNLPFRAELDSWATDHPELRLNYIVGSPLTATTLIELLPSLTKSLVYVSGPEPMVEALGNDLKAQALPEAQLKQDYFPNYSESNY